MIDTSGSRAALFGNVPFVIEVAWSRSRRWTNRQSPLVWMAAPLPILISDPNGRLTFQIFGLTVVSGQALQKPGMKSCGVCALGCSAFRGSDRFTVTKSVQEGRGISLSRRDLSVISALVAIRQGQANTAVSNYLQLPR